MKSMFPVLLSCGTQAYSDRIWTSSFELCSVHHIHEKIDAIETREWHVKCHDCRFGRWAGMSEQSARIIERKHITSKPGHQTSIDFMVPDDVREKWRQIFGKKRYPARFIGIKRTNIETRPDKPAYTATAEDTDPEGQHPPF